MKRKAMMGWVFGIPILVLVLILVIVVHEKEKDGITRAMAAKSVALVFLSQEELDGWQKEHGASRFPARTMDQWFVPYMDCLYELGYITEEEIPATEEDALTYLTYADAFRLAGRISGDLERLIEAGRQNSNRPIPKERWWLLYDALLKEADKDHQVEEAQIQVYGTVENIPGTAPWTAHTSLGTMKFSGLSLDGYIDHQLRVYRRDREIIHVLADEGQEYVCSNVWLADGNEQELLVCQGDIDRRIPLSKASRHVDEWVHNMADLQMKNGKIVKVSLKKDRVTRRVLSVQEDGVELEEYGKIPFEEGCLFLKTYGTLERQRPEDILVGYDMQEFVVARGKICAVLTVREFNADKIRVLLMDSGFQGIYHPQVTLRCPGAMTLSWGDDSAQVAAGEELVIAPGDQRLKEGRLIVQPEEGREIQVTSLHRGTYEPHYAGRLELVEAEEGLVLVNELYMEEYLKRVVPSEMPSSYELEALKAQAVCARTYAYMQIQGNTYRQYGAHVDDSTNFQVYNNQEPDERSTRAVDETYGKMMFHQGSPVTAYYFSTSCGLTADNGVWGGNPSEAPYLKSVTLNPGRKSLDLSSEEEFARFIKSDMTAYDSSYPFFRWNVVTNTGILSENIGGVGQVQQIRIVERGSSGVASKLLVTGSDGERTIQGQNAIRAALGDARLVIQRKDGKTTEGWSSLPSGFLCIEDLGSGEGGIHQFRICGGGYGHGVGMSQNGAQGMAKEGMGYEEILKFFYEGVSVEDKG
ncbi:MAG: SpoIID/LytB domain-containing protein [Lachnospiraceae bacterium]|nr:SpoIID/LytB domain-containing protein [Lachnospiraceae bacterium]MCI8958332.1 SpoIID/LytB domain-containing protein [Lachnospiraceae bacterium]